MAQKLSQTGDEPRGDHESRIQLALELAVFIGIALLLFLTSARIPAERADANFMLAMAVALHAVGFVRLAVRAADGEEPDPAS